MPTPIRGTISGSTAAVILGLNKYQTPFERWQLLMEDSDPGFNAKRGYTLPEAFEGNASTRFGNAFESANIALTEEALGVQITDRERVYTQSPQPFHKHNGEIVIHDPIPLSCHIDGMTVDGVLYEGKTASMQAFRSGWTDEKIPQSYFLQVQHNLYLTGADSAVVSLLIFPESPDKLEELGWRTEESSDEAWNSLELAYCPDGVFKKRISADYWAQTFADLGYHRIYHINRDDALISKMLEKYAEWWSKYIVGRTPPQPMNVDDIKRMYPDPVGTIVIEDTTLIDAVTEYREIGKETGKGGTLEKRRDSLKTFFLAEAAKLGAVADDDSTEKWVFRDTTGKKVASWGRNAKGVWVFR